VTEHLIMIADLIKSKFPLFIVFMTQENQSK